LKVQPPGLIVAMRCAVCGKGFSAEVFDLQHMLTNLRRRPTPPGALFALTCSECGSGGKSWKDGVLVRLEDAMRPLFGPVDWEEEG
jgi:hypothetical protein